MKQRTIKQDLIIKLISVSSLSLLSCLLLIVLITTNIFINLNNSNMTSVLTQATNYIDSELESYQMIAKSITTDTIISDLTIPFNEKEHILNNYVNEFNMSSIGIAGLDGQLQTTDNFSNNISDRDYFINLLSGINYVSSPSFVKDTDKQIIFIGVPIKNNDKIVGVLTCAFDSSFLTNSISQIKYLETGSAYIIDSRGNYVASNDVSQVKNKYSVINSAKEDSSLTELSKIHEKMLLAESGTTSYTSDNKKFISYNPLSKGGNWSIALEVDSKDVFSKLIKMQLIITFLFVLSLLTTTIVIILISNKLGKRLSILTNSIKTLSTGDFTVKLPESELLIEDEIGMIYKAADTMKQSLSSVILSIKNISLILNNKIGILDNSAHDINIGSNNISQAMNEVSCGNTTQASELLDINSYMNDFSVNLEEIAKNITSMSSLSNEIASNAKESTSDILYLDNTSNSISSQFIEYISCIENMNSKITSINDINEVINDISNKTNLLALNASIEASRAGESGKSFAVVASEIKKLSEQSKSSAATIHQLISSLTSENLGIIQSSENIKENLSNQISSVTKVLNSFDVILKSINDIVPKINTIDNNSKNILIKKDTIAESLENLSAISEELSATTQEVAASSTEFIKSGDDIVEVSTELSKSIDSLNLEVEKFIIE